MRRSNLHEVRGKFRPMEEERIPPMSVRRSWEIVDHFLCRLALMGGKKGGTRVLRLHLQQLSLAREVSPRLYFLLRYLKEKRADFQHPSPVPAWIQRHRRPPRETVKSSPIVPRGDFRRVPQACFDAEVWAIFQNTKTFYGTGDKNYKRYLIWIRRNPRWSFKINSRQCHQLRWKDERMAESNSRRKQLKPRRKNGKYVLSIFITHLLCHYCVHSFNIWLGLLGMKLLFTAINIYNRLKVIFQKFLSSVVENVIWKPFSIYLSEVYLFVVSPNPGELFQ